MKQRILVAVIGIPLLLLVLCWLPHWATAALLAALGVIGAHELLAAVSGPEKTKRLWVLAGVLAVLTVFATYAGREEYKGTVLAAAPWLLCAAAALLFLLAVRWYGRENAVAFQDICAVLLGGVAIPLAMSCLLRLRLLNYGGGLVLMPLVAAFMSDSAALFTGMACGKHKLASKASPKKTVEGAVGGLVGGALGMIVFRHAAATFHRLVHGHWLGGRVYGPAGRSELFCYQAPVRHQGLWPPAAGPRRRAGPV